jgi:hypothetical protein
MKQKSTNKILAPLDKKTAYFCDGFGSHLLSLGALFMRYL